MCTTCGCGQGEVRIDRVMGHSHESPTKHAHSPVTTEDRLRPPVHFGKGLAGVHVPGLSQARIVQIEQDILGKNNQFAAQNRQLLANHRVVGLNLVSSPGSGKTTLLVETLERLQADAPERALWQLAVIEGDQETSQDANRIRQTGVPAVQINTGKGCHLDAHMVGHACEQFDLANLDVLFIENVGNLVCPAAFDLGEDAKVVILSVTEGEDKPLKYPDMFHAASVMLLNKVDLLPYLEFDVAACLENARKVNPDIEVIQVSAKTGEGIGKWLCWIDRLRRAKLQHELDQLMQKAEAIRECLKTSMSDVNPCNID